MTDTKNKGFTQNPYVQATHKILNMLEQAKEGVEELLESVPELFIVISPTGVITKVNHAVAQIFNTSVDGCLGRNIRELIGPEGWSSFVIHMAKVSYSSPMVTFRMPLAPPLTNRVFDFTLKSFPTVKLSNSLALYGTDCSREVAWQHMFEQLGKILPIAMLSANQQAKIEAPMLPRQASFLKDSRVGQDIFEFLFEHVTLTEEQAQAVQSIRQSLGKPVVLWDEPTHHLPFEVPLVIDERKMVCRLQWSSIEWHGRMMGLRVLLIDETFPVKPRLTA